MRAWQALSDGSIFCRTEMEKVAVFPVPDWAWAMTSWPGRQLGFEADGKLTLDDGHDGALLDGRRALEAIGVDTAKELGLQVHSVKRVGGLVVVGLDLAFESQSC
jgi:hypothetical protein